MRKFIVKISICAALVMTFAFSAYADEYIIEICDGPVEMTEEISEQEIKKMQDGSMLPDYIKSNLIDMTAPESNTVENAVDILDKSAHLSAEDPIKADSKDVVEPYKPVENNEVFKPENSKESNTVIGNKNPSISTKEKVEISDIGPGFGMDKTKTKSTKASSMTSVKRQEVLGYARKFLGNRYIYGGNSLTEGTDCSGYVQQIFKKFGITTGRSSRDQYARIDKISKDMIRPGDLVFYSSGKEPSSINHVAIYCGDGIIIHACNSKLGIITSKMNFREPYAYGRFIKD